MANIALKDLQFPGLNNVYKIPEVDNTLTISGAAADAKKTGDELSDLKQELTQSDGGVVLLNLVPNKYLIKEDGSEGAYWGWSCTDFIKVEQNQLLTVFSASATSWNIFYDSNKEMIETISISAGWNAVPVPTGAKYVRFSNVTADIESLRLWLSPKSDTTLTVSGGYADSKTVGDILLPIEPIARDFDENHLSKYGERLLTCRYAELNYVADGELWQYKYLNPDRYVNVNANTTYVLSVGNNNLTKQSTTPKRVIGIYEYDSSGNTLQRHWLHENNNGILVFTTNALTTKIDIALYGAINAKPSANGTVWVRDVCLYKPESIPYYVPYYYEDHLASKLDAIKAHDDLIGQGGDRFIFITDTHSHYYGTEHSSSLIKRIQESTYVGMTVFGGDAINAADTEAICKKRFAQFFNRFRKVKNFFPIIGNHEFYSDWLNEGDYKGGITFSEVYSYFNKNLERIITDGDGLAGYCVDNPIKKIRYYFLGCDYYVLIPNQTITWMLNSLQNVPAGYTVIVIGHRITNITVTDIVGSFTDIHPALVAMNEGGDAICPLVLCGHTHLDGMFTKDGIHYAATTTDNWKLEEDSNLTRTVGEVTEQAFDVIDIDTVNQHIYFTRIGAGDNRDFSYGT